MCWLCLFHGRDQLQPLVLTCSGCFSYSRVGKHCGNPSLQFTNNPLLVMQSLHKYRQGKGNEIKKHWGKWRNSVGFGCTWTAQVQNNRTGTALEMDFTWEKSWEAKLVIPRARCPLHLQHPGNPACRRERVKVTHTSFAMLSLEEIDDFAASHSRD